MGNSTQSHSLNPSSTAEVLSQGHLTPNALRVLEARYLKRNTQGKIVETPEELFQRVAHTVAQAERLFDRKADEDFWQNTFQELLTSLDFLPNSPALMNAGMPLGQLSACFVLPVEDTMEDIFEAVKSAALVQRTGGGTGLSFSKLRPKGDVVHSTGGEASGPVSFMKIFDCATEHIKQGGKRRGANMGVLRVDHPDILEFVTTKRDGVSLQNFNLSVGITDDFLEAARAEKEYNLIHPQTHHVFGRLSAKRVFEAIVEAAWETGDPGLLFLDAINRTNPTPSLGSIEATNPCGEIPLLPNESCNLGSLHLGHFLQRKSNKSSVDWEKLRSTVRLAIRFLDDLIEVNLYPMPEIECMSRGNRKIGLGVMGLAEMLIRLGVPYDSEEGIQIGESIMRVVAEEAYAASQQLAGDRGVFPNWIDSVYGQQNQKMRNATRTAIAPTGTIGIIAGTTASIEPLFALAYRRSHSLGGESLYEATPLLKEFCCQYGVEAEDILKKVVSQERESVLQSLPKDFKRVFVTALDIPPEGHLQIQAAFQRHVDNSVSKTINLPAEATREDVASSYWRAWELGLKGITIYRYGSKDSQVLEVSGKSDPALMEHIVHCDPCECQV